jgi:hypothetical protein
MDQLFGKQPDRPGAQEPKSKSGLPEEENASGKKHILSDKEEPSFFGDEQIFDAPRPTGPAEDGGSLYNDLWNAPEPCVSDRASSRRPGAVVKSDGSSGSATRLSSTS